MLVRHWMTTDVLSVTPETSLLKCKKIFREHPFSALPVLDAERRVVGLLTVEDLRDFAPRSHTGYEALEQLNLLAENIVETVMRPEPATVPLTTPLEDAAIFMIDRHTPCLPVTDAEDRLAGIITEWDIFRALVRITGAREGGVLMAFVLENPYETGSLRGLLAQIRKQGGNILSVLGSEKDHNRRRVSIRFRAADRETEDAIIRSFAGDESLRYWSRDGETHSVHDTTADGVLEI